MPQYNPPLSGITMEQVYLAIQQALAGYIPPTNILQIPATVTPSQVVSSFFSNTFPGSQYIGYGANNDPAADASFRNLVLGSGLFVPNASVTTLHADLMLIASSSIQNSVSNNLLVSNSTLTNATATNQYIQNNITNNSTITNVYMQNASTLNATVTNLYVSLMDVISGIFSDLLAGTGIIGSLQVGTISATSSTYSPQFYASTTNASTSNIDVANIGTVNGSTINVTDINATGTTQLTNLYATYTYATTSSSTNGNVQNLFANNATVTNSTLTNATSTNFYTTNLTGGSTTLGSTTISNLTVTGTISGNNLIANNGTITNASSTNLFANFLSSLSSFIASLIANTIQAGSITATSSLYALNAYASSSYASSSYADNLVAITGQFYNTLFLGGTSPNGTSGYSTNGLEINDDTGVRMDISQIAGGGGTPSHNFLTYNGASTSPTVVNNNQIIGSTNYSGFDGSNFLNLAQIIGSVDGTVGSGDVPGRLSFLTSAQGAGSTTERMTIRENGNVGIGTTSPLTLLSVDGTFSVSALSTLANLFVTGSSTLASTTVSNLTVTGNLGVNNLNPNTLTLSLAPNGWLYTDSVGTVYASSSPTVSYITATTSTSTFKGIEVAGSIVPIADSVYDLGSPSKRFKSLYVSSTTIYIDGTALSNLNGQLTWSGSGIVATAGQSTLASTTISNATVTGSLYLGSLTQNGALLYTDNTGLVKQTNALAYNSGTNNLILTGGLTAGATITASGIDMNSTRITNLLAPVSNTDAVTKSYVDNAFASGVLWSSPVKTISTSTAPGGPATGDRYLLQTGQSGFGSCTDNDIAEWGGAAWVCTTPATGTTVFVDSTINQQYTYTGSMWVSMAQAIDHNSLYNLQGGQAGEYYHLKASDYTALTAGTAQLSNLRTIGNPTFNSLSLTYGLSFATTTFTSGTATNFAITNLTTSGSSTIGSTTASNLTVTGNFASNILNAVTGTISNLFASTAYISTINASTTNSTTSNITFLNASNATLTNATITNLAVSGTIQSTLTNGYVYRGSSANVSEATSTLYIANNGYVGIGNTNPQQKLHVNGLVQVSSTNDMYLNPNFGGIGPAVQVNATLPLMFVTNAAERVRIDSSGNVGIGNTSPTNILDVLATANSQKWVSMRNTNSGSSASAGLLLGNDGSAAQASLYINSSANTGFGGTNALNLGTYAANPIAIFTNNAERIRIDSSGNVGIGTISPNAAYKLDVSGIGRFTNGAVVTGGNAFSLVESTGNNTWAQQNNLNDLTFTYNGSEKLRVDATGNVGIGAASPGSKLNVVTSGTEGVIRANSWAEMSANSGGSGLFGGNVYTAMSDNTFRYSNTHASIGGIGFAVNYPSWNQASIIQSPTNSSTAGSTFTPNVIMSFGTGAAGNGNVGIGTTSPSQALSVVGKGVITGGLALDSNTPASTAYTLYNNAGTLMWNGSAVGGGGGVSLSTANSWTALQSFNSGIFANNGYITTLYSTTTNASTSNVANLVATNASATTLYVSGYLRDAFNSTAAWGKVLMNTGTSTQWVATSSLGISGGASTGSANTWTAKQTFSSGVNMSVGGLFDATNDVLGAIGNNYNITVHGLCVVTNAGGSGNGNTTGHHYTVGEVIRNCSQFGSTFDSADLAEWYETDGTVNPGEIVYATDNLITRMATASVYGTGENLGVRAFDSAILSKASSNNRSKIIGVISVKPAQVYGDIFKNGSQYPLPLALSGHVPVRMTLEGGNIQPGDPITISNSKKGYGMKATTSGKIIGFAIEAFPKTGTSTDDLVEVSVGTQDWVAPNDTVSVLIASASSTPIDPFDFSTPFGALWQVIQKYSVAWFATASNGISDFYTKTVHADIVCWGETCLNEAQVKNILNVTNSNSLGIPVNQSPNDNWGSGGNVLGTSTQATSTSTTTPPIEIQPDATSTDITPPIPEQPTQNMPEPEQVSSPDTTTTNP